MHTHPINLHLPKASSDVLSALTVARLLCPWPRVVQLYSLLLTFPNPEIQVWMLEVLVELL